MTLCTAIRVVDPVPVEPLFHFCQSLLGEGVQVWTTEPFEWEEGVACYRNAPGRRLAAWLGITYGPDGPLPPARYHYEPGTEPPPALIQVDWDTGYAYRGGRGAGCGDLHAWLVRQVVGWLTERRARYWWQNEYTGEWFDTLDRLPELGDAELGALR